jgi:hypothetical protein
MNSNVHPLVVALVLALTFVALAAWMWAGGEAASIGGPAELRTDREGHLYVQIQNQLIEHDADGEFLKTHDLSNSGVELFLGAFDFFANGDVLLRRGPDPRSFGDNLRAFQRKTNEQSLVPSAPESGLFRCDLDTTICTRFGQKGIDFKAAHSIFIDRQTDDVYISDTTRHVLRKYSANGVELAGPVTGFRFPNQLLVANEQLLVADTNHHRIVIVDLRTAKFGEIIDKKNVVPGEAGKEHQSWPSHFAQVGDGWWVNNMRTGMNEGGLYIFDENWSYDSRALLPPGADPISLIAYRDEVLVSDWDNDRIHRFSFAGNPLPDFKSTGLEQVLMKSRAARSRYEMMSYSGIILLALVIGGLMVRVLVVTLSPDNAKKNSAKKNVAEDSSTPELPLLLEPNPKTLRRMTMVVRFSALMFIVAGVSLAYIIGFLTDKEFGINLILPLAGMIAIIMLINWVNRANAGTSIEVRDGLVKLRDYSGRESTCPVVEIRYDRTCLATHDVVVFLGGPMASVFDQQALTDELFPRLQAAQKVSALQMQQIMIQLRHPQGLVTVLALMGLVIYVAWNGFAA